MLTTGELTSGYSRIGRRSAAMMPRINSSIDSTVAKTGRRIEMSESVTAARSGAQARRGVRSDELANRRAFTQLQRALRDHALALRQALRDFHAAGSAPADLHFALAHAPIRDDVHELPRLLRHQ